MKPLTRNDFMSESAKRVFDDLFSKPTSNNVVSFNPKQEMIKDTLDFSNPKTNDIHSDLEEITALDTTNYIKNIVHSEELSRTYQTKLIEIMPRKKEMNLQVDYTPDLGRIICYASSTIEGVNNPRYRAVIDEDANVMRQLLCLSGNIHYMLKGGSRSGKTLLVDKILTLIPQKEVYQVGLSSEMVVFHNASVVNNSSIIYIPEIQKLVSSKKNSPILEMIKTLAENKDSSRPRVNGSNVVTDIINAGKMIITTVADENQYFKNEDIEVKGRFIHFNTLETEEHITKVNDYISLRGWPGKEESYFDKEEYFALMKHLQEVRKIKATFIDPFRHCLRQKIPNLKKSPGYSELYYDLLAACAKFHHKDRFKEKEKIYIGLQDHFIVHSLFYDFFFKTLQELNSKNSEERETALQEREKILAPIDWEDWWKQGREVMERINNPLDKKAYSRWMEKQLIGGTVVLRNYLDDSTVRIIQSD